MPFQLGLVGEPPPLGTPAWYVRDRQAADGRWDVRCYLSEDHEDGAIVDSPTGLDAVYNLWQATVGDDGHSVLHINTTIVPKAPDLWFVALPTPAEVRQQGHANVHTLVGFATGDLPVGTVISNAEFFGLAVKSEEQVAAVRWWPDEAIVDQVLVAPNSQHEQLASTMIYAAMAYHQHRGWPGRLHSDGQVVKIGEATVTGRRHLSRMTSLNEVLPPLEPPDTNDR